MYRKRSFVTGPQLPAGQPRRGPARCASHAAEGYRNRPVRRLPIGGAELRHRHQAFDAPGRIRVSRQSRSWLKT